MGVGCEASEVRLEPGLQLVRLFRGQHVDSVLSVSLHPSIDEVGSNADLEMTVARPLAVLAGAP
jgi:hypothetical protein